MADKTGIEWTEVPGHTGYSVTATGFLRGPRGPLRPMVAHRGHLYVITGAGRKLYVHHAVLFAFIGPRPDGLMCRHLDGDPTNNALTNLRWGTAKENSADKKRHGRELRGEDKKHHRLTWAQVELIRADRRSSRVVGNQYGVSHTAILRIWRGQRWAA
jgi:hypothetical protein